LTDLAPVQLEAITRANGRRGFAFFMEMGLGKTLTVLTEFRVLKMCGEVERLVVICPNSFKSGWDQEMRKHDVRLHRIVYEASRKQRYDQHIRIDDTGSPQAYPIDVLIINYEAARTTKGKKAIIDFVGDAECYLALDESVKLKNRNSEQAKAIIGKEHKLYPKPGIAAMFKFVRLLSGKPMTQGPHDLWAQLKAIDATQGISYFGWQARFCQMGGWENRQVVGILNEDLLQKIIEPVAFQAKKKDWLKGLPKKTFTTRRYALGPVLQKHYGEMEWDFLTYVEGERISVDVAIAKWEKISQIQCGFVLNDGETTAIVEPDANPRLQLLQEILDEEVSGKVVIVYRHRAVGDMLSKHLGHSVAWIHGGMTPAEIDAEKWLFDRPHSRIMLLQAEAGKYGHTLIGTPDDPCSTMIFFENSYSLDTRSQIEDRIHRMGAVAESCLYVDLSGSDYDAGILRSLQRKERMFQAVFPEGVKAFEAAAA
jgi:Mesyanzhinovviridae DNA helicase